MDENLASPTCGAPESGRPALSIVVPAFDAADELKRCLERLIRHVPVNCEILVVDDASTDRSVEVAEAFGVRCFRSERRSGPASARNRGAIEAAAEWILFVDADVLLQPGAVSKAFDHVRQDSSIVALFGSYDDRPEAAGLVSRFRNLLHHHVHQSGRFERERRAASTFWTGCGLIRRDVFLACGGFDQRMFERPAIEDIELGYRLTEAGQRIVLARDVLCTHLKRWTLRSMIRTDFLQRGLPWSLLLLRRGQKAEDLNVDRRQKLAAVSAGASLAAIAAIPLNPAFGAMLLAGSIWAVVSINRSFLGLLRRAEGFRLAAAGVPLLYIYYFVCLASYATALAIHLSIASKRARNWADAASTQKSAPARHAAARPHFGTRASQESRPNEISAR